MTTHSTHYAPSRHLNQLELARRWTISPRTLERWRWIKSGPPFLKLGGRILYRLRDVENYEQQNLHTHDAALGGRQ